MYATNCSPDGVEAMNHTSLSIPMFRSDAAYSDFRGPSSSRWNSRASSVFPGWIGRTRQTRSMATPPLYGHRTGQDSRSCREMSARCDPWASAGRAFKQQELQHRSTQRAPPVPSVYSRHSVRTVRTHRSANALEKHLGASPAGGPRCRSRDRGLARLHHVELPLHVVGVPERHVVLVEHRVVL